MASDRSGWMCPRCGQKFAQRNARHSCAVQTVREFFEGYPAPKVLFKQVRAAIEKLGPVELVATKSQLSFRARTRFAWAWLPQQYLKRVDPDELVVTFDLPRRIRSRRIKEAVETRPGRWTHHVELHQKKDFDPEVKQWLAEAYAWAAPRVKTGDKPRGIERARRQ